MNSTTIFNSHCATSENADTIMRLDGVVVTSLADNWLTSYGHAKYIFVTRLPLQFVCVFCCNLELRHTCTVMYGYILSIHLFFRLSLLH